MDVFVKLFVLAVIVGTLIGLYVSLTAPKPPQDVAGWMQSDLEIIFEPSTDCASAQTQLLLKCATCVVITSIYDYDRQGCWMEIAPKE